MKLDPTYHTVPIENDRVRVLRTVLEPGIQSPLHEHPDNPRRKGAIAWRDVTKHETKNIGKETADEIQIELK